MEVGKRDALHIRALQEIVCAGRTLQTSAQHEHAHRGNASK
jgi:hypothetical protein